MTVCQVIDRVSRDTPGVEWVSIHWRDTVRRALRLQSESGQKINLLLERNHPQLHDGDVLLREGGRTLALRVRAVPVVYITGDFAKLLQCSAELGNAHLPLTFTQEAIITLDDGPARMTADRLLLHITSRIEAFHPARFSVLSPVFQPLVSTEKR
jgi:urease accessory protein UreE